MEKERDVTINGGKGYVYLPLIFKTRCTTINNEVVWYSNSFLNLLLKIKHFFFKSKNLKNHYKYVNKKVNGSYYGVINSTNKL